MKVIGVIPARMSSTRLPQKLIKPLSGKTVIEWTWRNAKKSTRLDDLIIACDDQRIANIAQSFGAKTVLTSVNHTSGTDRICEAIGEVDAKIVVNIQADEPLIHPSVIDSLVETLSSNPDLVIATAVKQIVDEEDINNPNVVKAVLDKDSFALYFSRATIPFLRDKDTPQPLYYKHIGIYAYTKDFLYVFKNLPESGLEKTEKLEQLRVLEAGFRIKAVVTSFDSWGIDTEEDLAKVEGMLTERGSA